jgi:transposase InsO family protein
MRGPFRRARLGRTGLYSPRLHVVTARLTEPAEWAVSAHGGDDPSRMQGQPLYVLVIGRLARRDLVWINVTPHPTAEWIARQIIEAFPWNEAPRYLLRDRDRVYGAAVMHRLRAMGIRDKPIAPGSPWQNGFAERLIGSIRRECVDHGVVLGEAHLRRILTKYYAYYNELRTHRSLDKDAPIHRAIQHVGRIISAPVLGGIHHQYCRI